LKTKSPCDRRAAARPSWRNMPVRPSWKNMPMDARTPKRQAPEAILEEHADEAILEEHAEGRPRAEEASTSSIRFVVKARWKTADDMSYSMGRHTMPLKTPASDGRPGIVSLAEARSRRRSAAASRGVRWAAPPRRSDRGRRPGGGEVTEPQHRYTANASPGSVAEALCSWTSA
jgi:hypothetical protein